MPSCTRCSRRSPLVVLVIIVFLQKWRAALIPVIAIPVSLIGSFAVLAMLGLSLNNLSLFGLVLAIGIVVDDAIVVVENVERNLEQGMSPLQAARVSMDEVSAALVAIVLVLCAVFVPTLFIGGLSGAFYQQFAITISAATIISLVLSLTLSPAMAALLLKPHEPAPSDHSLRARAPSAGRTAGGRFNRGFERMSARYAAHDRLSRPPSKAFDGRLCRSYRPHRLWRSGTRRPASSRRRIRPTSWTIIQLPPGSSTARTDAVMKKVAERMLPIPGVKGTVMLSGFDGASETRAAIVGRRLLGTRRL